MEETQSVEMTFADLVADSWRFAKDYRKVVTKLDAHEQGRFANKLNYYLQQLQSSLERLGMKLENLEEQPFEMGMAAVVLNLDEFSEEDALIVDQMLEPVILGPKGVIRMGKIMVRKARL